MHDSNLDEAMRELDAENYESARSLLQTLSSNKEAQLQLAYLYQQGLGGPPDPEKAREIYKSLADAGDPQGMYYLASLLLESRQLSEAARYFERAAELDHVSGSYWAAALYDGLYGHPRDEEKYQRFIKKAASLGHLFAMRDLARADMKHTKNWIVWGEAFLRYLSVKIKGFYIAIRNPHDLRLR